MVVLLVLVSVLLGGDGEGLKKGPEVQQHRRFMRAG